MKPVLTTEESMMWWHELANHAERMGDYYQSRGEYDGVERAKAVTYRRTVVALFLEEDTGLFHCACCLKTDKQREAAARR